MLSEAPPKLALAHLPTPLWHSAALDRLAGAEVWVKRDDMTAGAEAGNKIRKLEYLLADAERRGARVVLTCGAAQSNHARATALLARSRGLRAVLFLRTTEASPARTGNLLLDELAGAELRWITPEQYRERDALMAEAAEALLAAGETPYVIPEGGSNALGSLGYADAARELRQQLDLGLGPARRAGDRASAAPFPFSRVVVACGSGGTAAGLQLGVRHFGVCERVEAIAVCDDRATFEARIGALVREMSALVPGLDEPAALTVHDAFKGPAYGVPSAEQRALLRRVARDCGLVLDPVYTVKALHGLIELAEPNERLLFMHTGGLPGLLAGGDGIFE